MDKILFKPFELLLNSLFEPINNMLNEKMFLMDQPFKYAEFIHKYEFIAMQAYKLLGLFIFISLLLTILSSAAEKRQMLTFFSESVVAIMLLFGNAGIVFIINYILVNISSGISGDIAGKIFGFFVGGLAASIIAVLNPAGLILGIGLGALFFLLFAGLDMLEIFSQVMVLISPLLICTYPIKGLRHYCDMFYKIYISIHLAVLFQGAVFFVAMLNTANADVFSKLTVGIGSLILCIFVAPMILFKAIGSASKGVE